jgi:pimeloyl-[acyl-carrier protein] synthase
MNAFDAAVTTNEFRNNPYPHYAQLRESDPVHWCEPWGCWVLTRYADICSVLQDFGTYSNRGRVTNTIEREYPRDFLQTIKPLLSHFKQGLINVDPPDHPRLRRLIQKAFIPKTLEILRPKIEQLVAELLGNVSSRSSFDLIQEFAYPLPVQVIAEMLGVPPSMRETFKEWSYTILQFQAVPRADQQSILTSQTALVAMRTYLAEVVADRRKNPTDDLLGELVRVEEEGTRLSHEELLSTGVSLLVAGHETTTNLIANATYLLLKNPAQREVLMSNPALYPAAVEESLRVEAPLQRLGRSVVKPSTIGGKRIDEGKTVLSLLGAANRDPGQFAAPDSFDLTRRDNKHIAFGSGIHFCLGAALARLEGPIALKALFARYPKLQLANESVEWHSGVMRGPKELSVGQF